MIRYKNIRGLLKALLLAVMVLLCAVNADAQTEVKAPMTSTPAAGEYYSYSGITLAPGFSFTAAAGSSFHAYVLSPDCQPLNGNFSTDRNFIVTSVPSKGGMRTAGDLVGRNSCELMQTVQYIDGLGRPLQTVGVRGSASGQDVVQPVVYDPFGREVLKYQAYAAPGAADGSYKANAVGAQASFYAGPPSGIAATNSPYSQTVFEASPLNRVLEQGAPGADWQPASGHTQKIVYTANNETALGDTANTMLAALYVVTSNANQSRTLTRNGNYAAGQLYVTITKDENWKSGRGGTTEEYKDKEDHVVLKRTFNYAEGTLQILSTYYVYDEMGNLAYVLPPGTNPDGAGVPVYTGSLGYSYRYDERNRLTQKKIPGQGWEFTVYNKLDQPVLSQDSVQRQSNQWTVTKYDAQERVIMTGLWNAGSLIQIPALQANIYAGDQWDVADKNANTTAYPLGYRVTSYPALSKVLMVNYYDDYQFPQNPFTARVGNTMTQPTGLLTGSQVAVLNTITNTNPDMLRSVHYYDDKGRKVQSYQQHYLGGVLKAGNYDVATTSYTFLNADSVVVRQHYVDGTAVPRLTATTSYDYDHMGRRVNSWEQIQNGGQGADTKVLVAKTDYNEIGQSWKKHLHSGDQGGNFKQDITYGYNERGWLLSSTAPLFNMYLYYNTGTGGKQYNGNITNQLWQTGGGTTNVYSYGYDQLNRLTAGISTTGDNENGISYDAMGNITGLTRYSKGAISDQLSYSYPAGSTRLQQVTDGSGSDVGQKNGTTSYGYDGNGNLISDNSKGITGISYNLLNLPQAITGKSTSYVYDANGQKLRRVIGTSTTDYIGGIQYEGTSPGTPVLSFIQTEEGRALPNGAQAYNYEYTLADHLGNSRVNFDTGSGVARQVQADDYFPFGMDVAVGTKPSLKNNYLYNKKELQDNLGLYDYGARFYDPVIARWTSVDKLAEESRRWSPYNYGEDDPIGKIDPDGMQTQPGPQSMGNPMYYIAEGFRQYFQAAGSAADRFFASFSTSTDTKTSQASAGGLKVTTSVNVTNTTTVRTNLGGLMETNSQNTPQGPAVKVTNTTDVSQQTKVEASTTIRGVDVKATNITNVSSSKVSNTTELSAGKTVTSSSGKTSASASAFVSVKHTSSSSGATSQTDVGVKANATYTPTTTSNILYNPFAGSTVTQSFKIGFTVDKH